MPELGGRLWVVNTHFSHKPWAVEHRRQAVQLLGWLRGPEFCGLPLLLSGDFNGPPFLWGGAYYAIMRTGEWADTFLEVGHGNSATIPASFYRAERGSWLSASLAWLKALPMRIDYVLAHFLFEVLISDKESSSSSMRVL